MSRATRRSIREQGSAKGAVAIASTESVAWTENYPAGLWAQDAGSIQVILVENETTASAVTFDGVQAGSLIPISVRAVVSTGTTIPVLALFTGSN